MWKKKLAVNLHTGKFLSKVCSGLEAVPARKSMNGLQISIIESRLDYAIGMQDRFKRDKIHNPETTSSIKFTRQIALSYIDR